MFMQDQPFEIGKALTLIEGSDVTIFATGHMVWRAIEAEAELEKQGISAEVINIHTIKPLDEEVVLNSLAKTGCAVTAEEHQMAGGLGESIAGTLVRNELYPQEFVAVNDQFGESGKPDQLLDKYGLGVTNIVKAARRAIERK